MALEGYPKTYETPKVHIGKYSAGATDDFTVDGICDLIKVTGSGSDPSSSHGSFQVWYHGEDKTATGHIVELGAGDVLEGPFIKVFWDSSLGAGNDTEGYAYERSSITSS